MNSKSFDPSASKMGDGGGGLHLTLKQVIVDLSL